MKNALGSNPSIKENSIIVYFEENGYHTLNFFLDIMVGLYSVAYTRNIAVSHISSSDIINTMTNKFSYIVETIFLQTS